MDSTRNQYNVVSSGIIYGRLQRRIAPENNIFLKKMIVNVMMHFILQVQLRTKFTLNAVQNLMEIMATLALNNQKNFRLFILFNSCDFGTKEEHPVLIFKIRNEF